jgi:hypothetical protein
MQNFLKLPSVKTSPILIVGVVIVGTILAIWLMNVGENIWTFISWNGQKQIEVTNEAVAHNDISICKELPLTMVGDGEIYPRQECVDSVNKSRR